MTDEQLRSLIIFGTLGICIVIVLILQYTLRKKQETQLLDWTLAVQKQKVDELKNYKDEILSLLAEIENCVENGGDMHSMTEACRRYTGARMSGNSIVDALIAYKKDCSVREGILMEVTMDVLPDLNFTDAEYVGLFGNLLDNAMEAAAKTEQPWVRLTSAVSGGQWIIKAENSKRAAEKPLERAMESTKGSGHGIGLKIISRIVKQHKGVIEYEDAGDAFHVMIVFGIEERKQEKKECGTL